MPESPITRKEKYLAKISGETVAIPSPITREEQYLYEIAVNGTGGGGGTTNYNSLANKPSINGVTLAGNKMAKDLNMYTKSEIDEQIAEMNLAIQENARKIEDKVDKVSGMGLSKNNYTDEEKTKLSGIATGANKTTVDSALSSSSTNPVQNKVIQSALAGKVDKVSGKQLSTNDYTNEEKTKLAGLVNFFTQGTSIPENSDLDEYKTPGVYFVWQKPTADTLANCPVSSAFRMEVTCLHLSNRYVQRIYAVNFPEKFFMRYTNDATTWQKWYQFSGTAVS